MNKAITDKSTLEGTKSRITEAQDRISEVEDSMVEINREEKTNKKKLKEMRKTSDTSGTRLNTQKQNHRFPRRRRRKRKGMRKYFRR